MYVYRYELVNGDKGTFRTNAKTIKEAREQLKKTYGERLLHVIPN